MEKMWKAIKKYISDWYFYKWIKTKNAKYLNKYIDLTIGK